VKFHHTSINKTTDQHALAVLAAAESWGWPFTKHIQSDGAQGGKHKALTAKLLSCLITESRIFDESMLVDEFWNEIGKCHVHFPGNSEIVFIIDSLCTESNPNFITVQILK